MNRKLFVGVISTLALALMLAACGGSSSSNPASPSATSAGTGQAGATISGTVSGATGTSGSAAGFEKLDSTNGITVTISGTNLTVAVDAQGRFTFTGIPAGTVQLVFSGKGATATLTLSGVQATDKITIQVTLKGTTASLDDEKRNGATMTELEEQISAVNPAARTLVVGGTRVSVPASAVIRHGDATVDFSSLKVGDRVHVRGSMGATEMTATEVMVQNTNTNPGVNASGTVTVLTQKACPVTEFVVGGWAVMTDASTDFQKTTTCSEIAVGRTVHVKGVVQPGPAGKVLASSVQVK